MFKKIVTTFIVVVLLLTITPAKTVMAEEDLSAMLSYDMVLTWTPYSGANFDHYEIEVRSGTTPVAVISDLTDQNSSSFDLKTNSDVQSSLDALYGNQVKFYDVTITAYNVSSSVILGSSFDGRGFLGNGMAIPPTPISVNWFGNSEDGYGVRWLYNDGNDDLEYYNASGFQTTIILHDVTGGMDRNTFSIGGMFDGFEYNFGNVMVPGHSYKAEVLSHGTVNSWDIESESMFTSSIITVDGAYDISTTNINATLHENGRITWDYDNMPSFIRNIKLDYYKDEVLLFSEYINSYNRGTYRLQDYVKNLGAGSYSITVTPGGGNSVSSFVMLGFPVVLEKTYSDPVELSAPTEIIMDNGFLKFVGPDYSDVQYVFNVYKYDSNYPQNYNPSDIFISSASSTNEFSILYYYKNKEIAAGDKLVVVGHYISDSAEYLDSPNTISEVVFDFNKVERVDFTFDQNLRVGGQLHSRTCKITDYELSGATGPENLTMYVNREVVEYSTSGLSGTWSTVYTGDALLEGYYRYRVTVNVYSDSEDNPWLTPDIAVTCDGLNFTYDGDWGIEPYSRSSYIDVVSDSFYLKQEKVTDIDVKVTGNLILNDIVPGVTKVSEITGRIQSAILTTDKATYDLTENAIIYITNNYGSVVDTEETLVYNHLYTLWVVINDDYETIWTTSEITKKGIIADWDIDPYNMASISHYIFTKQFRTPIEVSELFAGERNVGGIEIYWDDFADTYEIYRSENGENGVYKYIDVTPYDNYVDNTVVGGKTYTYKIRGVVDATPTDYSNAVTAVALPENITGFYATSVGCNSVDLTWSAGSGTGYKVYKSSKENGSYSLVTTISNPAQTSYTVRKLKENTELFFKVTAINKVGTKTYESPIAEATSISVKTLLATPILKGTSGHQMATISWKKQNNVNYYVVERSENGGAYECIVHELYGISFVDNEIENGSTYTYRITAINDDNNSDYALITLTPTLGTVKINKAYPRFSALKMAYLDMNMLDDVNEYEAYVSTSSRGPFVAVAPENIYVRYDHLEISYDFENGKTYYIKVAPVQNGITGSLSNTATLKMVLNTPKITQTYDNNGRVNTVMDFNGSLPYRYSLVYSENNIDWNLVSNGSYVGNLQLENTTYVDISKTNYFKLIVEDGNGTSKVSSLKKVSYSLPTPTLTLSQSGIDGVKLNISVKGDGFKQEVYCAKTSTELKTKIATGSTEAIATQYGQNYSLYYSGHDVGSTYYYAVVITDSLGKSKTVTKTIKINAPAPTITKAAVVDVEKVGITVKSVPYTSHYRLLTSADNITYTLASEFYTSEDVYTINWYGDIGAKRYFKVEPVVAGYTLPVSAAKSVNGTVKAPTVKSAVVVAPGDIKVTIAPSKGVPFRCDVYRKDVSGTEILVKMLYDGETEFINHVDDYNGTYSYRVMAYYPSGTTTSMSSLKTVKAKYPAPDFSLISSPAGKISIIPSSKNVEGYEIYSSLSSKGTYNLTKTIASGRTTVIHPTGKTVYFKVRSYVTVDGVKQYSPFSVVKSVVAQ